MLAISIVNNTSQEANWNGRRTGRQADGQDHVLSQADALTKKMATNLVKRIFIYFCEITVTDILSRF